MKTYFVDTNIFLRVAVKEDEKSFSQCSLFLKTAEAGKIKIVTSNFVLAECVWVLESFYKIKKNKILKILKGIRALRNIKLEDDVDLGTAMRIFSKINVKYIDALIASNPNIQAKKLEVVSYDKDLDKIGVIRKEPTEIINKFYN